MYAVIETGGKQYRVSEGEIVRVERLARWVTRPLLVRVLRAPWLTKGAAAR